MVPPFNNSSRGGGRGGINLGKCCVCVLRGARRPTRLFIQLFYDYEIIKMANGKGEAAFWRGLSTRRAYTVLSPTLLFGED